MFWNDPEHYLERIILIEDEDDILSIPRQIQVYCICLGLSQANKPVSLYSVHTVQCKHCTMYTMYNQQLETSSAILCTHSTAKLLSHVEAASPPKLDLSPGGPGRGQFTARPTTRWEGPISRVCLPFPSTGFPGLGWPREGTPPSMVKVLSKNCLEA